MFLTPLLIHRKLPVTARTAGRCDWPEAPPATPVFILLFLSSPGSLPETWKSAHGSVPHRCGESLVLSCHLRRCLVLSPHSPDKGRRQGFAGHGCSPSPSPDTAAHRGKQGRNWHLLLWAVVSLIKSDIQEAISMGRCSLLIVLLEDLISVVYTLLKIR